jgi:hypothetical protein
MMCRAFVVISLSGGGDEQGLPPTRPSEKEGQLPESWQGRLDFASSSEEGRVSLARSA